MFHPELNFDIARTRQDALLAEAARHRAPRSGRRRLLDRWRGRAAESASPPARAPRLVVVPPPRHGRDPTGHDERVA